MKKYRSKNGKGIGYSSILSVVIISITFFIGAPHLCGSQDAAHGEANRIKENPSSGPGLASDNISTDRHLPALPAASYSLADLEGTWNVNTLASGPGAPYWFRGRFTVDPDGSWSGTGQDYGEPPKLVSGTFVISADGTITINASAAKCRMDSGKTVIVCTETWKKGDPGTSNLIFFTKEAGSYSPDDLTGQWEANILVSGPDTYNWERGPVMVNSDGTFTMNSVDSNGTPYTTNDTFTITQEGLITMAGMPTAQCRMDISKTVIVCTDTSDNAAFMLTLVKKADTYSMDDLVGSWSVNSLASGPGAPWWERGIATLSPDGSFIGKIEDYDGTTYKMSGDAGAFAISSDGIVNISVGDGLRCAMNSVKTVFICTGTWLTGDPGTTEMKVFAKRPPCTYTMSSPGKSMKAKESSTLLKVTALGDNCVAPSITPVEGWITASVKKWEKNKGSVKVTVEKNNSSIARNGSVMIEGQSFAVSQKGQKCVIQGMVPSSQFVPVTGGAYSFLFTIYPNDCSWTASTTSAFLHIPNPSRTGTQTVDFSVDPNTTLKKQYGKITMLLPESGKKKNFFVKQAAN